MGKGGLGPEVCDLEATLQRDGGRDDLAEHCLQPAFRELPLAERNDAVEHGPLPGRSVGCKAVLVLDLTYPSRQPRASVEQAYDLLVHRINSQTDFLHLLAQGNVGDTCFWLSGLLLVCLVRLGHGVCGLLWKCDGCVDQEERGRTSGTGALLPGKSPQRLDRMVHDPINLPDHRPRCQSRNPQHPIVALCEAPKTKRPPINLV